MMIIHNPFGVPARWSRGQIKARGRAGVEVRGVGADLQSGRRGRSRWTGKTME